MRAAAHQPRDEFRLLTQQRFDLRTSTPTTDPIQLSLTAYNLLSGGSLDNAL
jgi:hypothetical protein